ncbi:hypothetical protein AXE80_07065 [Wenyingzhuangia fucanilytica]|uniref:Macroglobulin domain-containing protein n=1 Tax=Wenyingzhuangia fucanilytica TaxID=1790137 RepID=A0A1B1Y5L5_9FLAO|nr:hypothetical protein [Wenyingzhuangia fucanilytica]ANW96050.1 hypothetical protein AXE80_07065 [Wenyingzhuangia fucanilytica]
MKNRITIIFLNLLLLTIIKTYSQEKPPLKIASKNAYAEKIYLQPVSTVFTTDKTIWFKAIVTDLEHLPTKLSAVLHVDLIDFDKNIIDSKLLKIENGVTDGYFDLNEELPSGRYLIRAYTEWNKNFSDDFISQIYVDLYAPKEIKQEDLAIREITLQETENEQYQISAKAFPKLLNPEFKGKLKMYIHTEKQTDSLEVKKDENDIYSFSYLLPKDAVKARLEFQPDSIRARNFDYKKFNSYSKTITVNKEYLDLQFFPEGGKLVDGLNSKVAFKALDYNNKGKQVTGNIVDQDNNIIMPFQSNNLGMGITQLTPNIQKKYYAVVKGKDDIEYKYPIPEIHKTGFVLKVKEVKEFIVLSLETNQQNQEPLHVKAQVRGVVYDEFEMQFQNNKVGAGIEKSLLPEGIVKFTITNPANQIVAERLFFNDKEEEQIYINTTLNKQQFKQREKTTINIITEDEDVNGIQCNLSVLVINKEQLGKENSLRSNILSYFLLNSELKGSIEKPNEYFNPKNKRRKHDLDALLLTQGWSNYKYENTAFTNNFKYLQEKGLTISGRIKNQWFSKRELKKPIELTAVYGPLNVAIQEIDSSGYFKMKLEDYYKDKFKVMLQTKDEKGKKKDFTIELEKYESPKIHYKKEEIIQFADSTSLYVKENILKSPKEENLTPIEGVIELEEVELTGYVLTAQRKKVMDLHGAPDFVVENEEIIKKAPKWNSGLYSVLQASFPDDIHIISDLDGNLFANIYGRDVTLVLVDGIPVQRYNYILLQYLSIEEVKSFEVINKPKYARYHNDRIFRPDYTDPDEMFGSLLAIPIDRRIGIISIYTYAGKGFYGIKRNKGISKGFVQGFIPKREFYTPKHENLSPEDWQFPDVRSVVHWNPNVTTDEYGEAKIEYYNADNTGEMLIVIEVITKKGKFGYYETSYQVEEK